VDVLLLKINLGDDIATKLGKMAFGKQQESVTGVENTAGDLLSDDRVGRKLLNTVPGSKLQIAQLTKI